MKTFFDKIARKLSITPLISAIVPFCLLLIFFLPQSLLAAESGKPSSTPFAGGGGILIWLVCYIRRKNPIGGWLLYYFIGLYVGFFISISLTVPSLSNYNPLEWDDNFHYFLFIITTIPGDIFLLAQVILSFFMISQKRRDWKYIEILKKVLLADFVFSVCSIPIEASLWPASAFFSVYSAILSLIWFFYFKKSVRVQYVFKDKLWNAEIFYPTVKVKKN
jgi:hypothetical protein